MSTFELNDIRCIACGSDQIVSDDTHVSIFECAACGYEYQSVWGVPFFGSYEEEDILGLIEISANIQNRKKFGITPSVVEHWERLLTSYDQAEDKGEFIKSNSEAQDPYLLNRYGEWVEIAELTRDLNLHNSNVLDVGAGLGFDSHRLTMLGANVTALEFSPVLAEWGKLNFPHIRWVGGLSHYLPFKSASFDAVFCNAALHHMRDIPATISEALRVLRPGGVLITTCDSFRPSDSGDEAELEIFDTEPVVLQGVNEGMPRFSDFVETLKKHPNSVDVELYTHMLNDAPSGGSLSEFTRWKFDRDEAMLSRRSGSIALRVRLKGAWPDPATVQKNGILAPSEYVSWTSSASNALAKLAPLLPAQYLDLPFPGTTGSKFELLNGWRVPQPFHQARTAYQRGRWFLRRADTQDNLIFDLGLTSAGTSKVSSLTVLLNGEEVSSHSVCHTSWNRVSLDISRIPVGQVFAVEIQQKKEGASLEESSFIVRNRLFISSQQLEVLDAQASANSTERPTVFAVIPTFNRLHFTRGCIQDLKAQNYKPLRIIVADGGSTDGTVEAIRQEHPDVEVLTSESVLWWAGSMAMGIDHALRISLTEEDFILMMNNDTQILNNYVETLVLAANTYNSAVGALVVDSRDETRILDAGEYIDWATYSFPVKSSIGIDECFCDDVDFLPGRGSLIPLKMIRDAGNVNAKKWPHYIADYEFFYRLKQHGYRLGICYETRVLAHIEETGIVPTNGNSGYLAIWSEIFSRRSMNNLIDHWRFVGQHAPAKYRGFIQLRLLRRVIAELTLRTPLRPFFLPVYWLICLPQKILIVLKGQRRSIITFIKAIRKHGINVLCNPRIFPGLIRWPLYFMASPGPIRLTDVEQHGLKLEQLIEKGILRSLNTNGWVVLETLKLSKKHESLKLKRLFWTAWNPFRKLRNTLAWRRDAAKKANL